METAFLEIAAGIFPEELYSQIPGEELAIMGMTAELQVSTGFFQFF